MGNPFQDSVVANDSNPEEFSINFVGKELFYSDQTINAVQSEFGVSTRRIETIDALPALNGSDVGAGKVVVVDQMLLDDLLTRPQVYSESAGSGCLAFAYRKEDAARLAFENWDRGQFGDIGYLPMNVAPDVWRSILRLLLHEELYLPCFLADCVVHPQISSNEPQEPASKPSDLHPIYSKLTRREKQVLQLVSKGQSNKIIASNLGITEHTVKLHMHNVAGKIGVSNRTAAAQFFFEVAPNEARNLPVD
ncbi:response regulator transcription factor [Ruegeria sp. Ofav3-42]|uniref:helix-turn-helix transcriptional regulator n=1 Tax=Ruegeria sp. Ofav3-42 TaxID=2917759 RepID=UPI001EF5663C|nr:response regulator transcription factor [Ruegeria sp. Ofav3-42]MCG7518875.1 response regulator transcription factor [Ruegeria sp. Ofav3-42]